MLKFDEKLSEEYEEDCDRIDRKIKKIFKSKNMTQLQFAKSVGVSGRNMTEILGRVRKGQISLKYLKLLAHGLGVEMKDLL